MNFHTLLKKTLFYKYIYHPYRVKQERTINNRKHAIFAQYGAEVLTRFVKCMQEARLDYWLEFGTLLGAYRDADFVPNEIDLDVGANLQDASQIYELLTQKGFHLTREFHIIGENKLEQTYEMQGVTLDVMYFEEEKGEMWCYGAVVPTDYKPGKPFFHQVTAHHFRPFGIGKIQFLGMEMCVPDNTEEHLIEIFGTGYKVYDPDFKGDQNKIFYSWEDKNGLGFIYY